MTEAEKWHRQHRIRSDNRPDGQHDGPGNPWPTLCVLLNGKQVIHGYLILNDVVVAVVGDTISCYHDKMKGTSVFRQFLVCTLFVLQIFRIVIVNGEDVIGVFHLTEVGKAVGSLYHQVNLRPASLGCSTGKP